ncbi:hypothetical protein ACFL6U_31270 [Planctomycetota bacterium]
MDWKIQTGEKKRLLSRPPQRDSYPNHTTGFSFHSPHVTTREKHPGGADNFIFTANYQDEYQIVTDPENPFYLGAGYWQGTGIRNSTRPETVIMDTGILTILRPDGDVIFYVATCWYGKTQAEARLVGGTGKWRNIDGLGTTAPGKVGGPRVDRNFILNWQFHWGVE